MKTAHTNIGYDLIVSLIPEKSRVLDLGRGEGTLLDRLQKEKQVSAFGVEISERGVTKCVEKGLYCYQADIDEGLADYRDNSFDFVILNQTLQSTKRPDLVVREIMRIGKRAIISFPNFAHLPIRWQFLLRGSMPKGNTIPFEWYESPNIHMVTIHDFESFCRKRGYPVKGRHHFSINSKGKARSSSWAFNLFAQYGFFLLDGESFTGDNSA